jgi:DNA-binding response OmpR family regulator/pSer/pThr/pTyr-binding forkhead associated (FHA) protein
MGETQTTPWLIELTGAQLPKPLKMRLDASIVLGRLVEGDSKPPDVDLEPFGAGKHGVSRHHAEISAEHEQLTIKDLDTPNGTFVNGERLKPHEPRRLGHNDRLQLGRMKLDLQIVISPTYGSGVHKQPSLQLHDQTHPGKGELVLVIEDDPEVAKMLALVLERAGYTSKISSDVVGAIRLFNQKRPAAILLDLMLPDMSGLEFCRYVRRDVVKNTTPIIVVSAAKSPAKVNEAMQAGADIFLDKPVSVQELRHVVSSLIEQHESGSSAIYTKQLVGTAPLKAVPPESRRDAAVMFIAGYSDSPITLTVTQPISFGRALSTGNLPSKNHVDLTRYDAINYGVSRVHMYLHNKDGKFFVEDADSINGTYINGDPIKPHELIPVKNATEIRLGQLRMYIYFLESGEKLP